MGINLWDPQNLSFIGALLVSYLLGIVHGITPDEHTWPITFSYAVGSGTAKGGVKSGLIFSSGFTLQRALMSEAAYFALAGIFMTASAFGIVYFFVGIVMLLAGAYIKRKSIYPHWHWLERKLGMVFGMHKHDSKEQNLELEHKKDPLLSSDTFDKLNAVPSRTAFLHGLIAGFGFGAFALILYTTISPSMPNMWVAWLPGLIFGLGTMTMQMVFGAAVGIWFSKIKKMSKEAMAFVTRSISSDVLFYGGISFAVAGIAILAFPQLMTYGITTGIKVHNIDNLGIGFFLVIFVVIIISAISYHKAMKEAKAPRRRKPVRLS